MRQFSLWSRLWLAVWLVLGWKELAGRGALVFIHIGPHKTGTTYIQSVLTKNSAELLKQRFCFPLDSEDPKSMHVFANSILTGNAADLRKTLQPIRSCLDQGLNLILSSETLSYLPYHHRTTHLKSLFANHTVRIVGVYREWLQHFYSSYAQENKLSYYTLPFSTFAFNPSSSPSAELMARGKAEVFRDYQRMFGAQNLTLIDYYGVRAARKDLAEVILCEVMGVLCAELRARSVSVEAEDSSASNATPSMLLYNLFGLVRDFAKGLGCRYCHSRQQTFFAFIDYYNQHSLPLTSFPTLESQFAELKAQAMRQDGAFRSDFGARLLYSNSTASATVIQGFRVKIVNSLVFFSDCARCTQWLRDEIMRWKQAGLLCGCEHVHFAGEGKPS